MQDGYIEYDGGAKGLSVIFSVFPKEGSFVKWSKNSTFISGDINQIVAYLKGNGYAYSNNLAKKSA